MEKKTLLIIAAVVVILVGGLIFLASNEKTGTDPVGGAEAKMLDYAGELGLDMEQFQADLVSDDVRDAVARGLADGTEFGIQGTPTIVINGAVASSRTIEDLQTAIDEAAGVGEAQEIPEGFHSKGATEPVVLIEEYSDFQCPACRSAFPILAQIVQDNSETTALVYKHFPLNRIHEHADLAARAAEAAGKQGKFWEMHDMLFERQRDWR